MEATPLTSSASVVGRAATDPADPDPDLSLPGPGSSFSDPWQLQWWVHATAAAAVLIRELVRDRVHVVKTVLTLACFTSIASIFHAQVIPQ